MKDNVYLLRYTLKWHGVLIFGGVVAARSRSTTIYNIHEIAIRRNEPKCLSLFGFGAR